MISFIGAGPGDPELLTLKGKRLIDGADVIIYAGSLVNPEVLSGHKDGAKIYNSALMDLDEVIEVMEKAEKEGTSSTRSSPACPPSWAPPQCSTGSTPCPARARPSF